MLPSKVLSALRENPRRDVSGMLHELVGPVVERIVTTSAIQAIHTAVFEYTRDLVAEAAKTLERMRTQVVAVQMDAASDRSVAIVAIRTLRSTAQTLANLGHPEESAALAAEADALTERIDMTEFVNPTPNKP